MKTETLETKAEPSEGNTKASEGRITPAKRWAFTLNNYKKEHIDILSLRMAQLETKFIWGEEVGEKGTPHLQGYIEFKKKVRPTECIGIKQIHWEKCKGNREQNVKYCSKEGKYVTNFFIEKPIKVIENLRPWQAQVLETLIEEPNDRNILWIWEENGKVGKSAFSKYLCVKKNAMVCEGRSTDIFNGIYNYREQYGEYPKIVIIDCPRSNTGYMNYGALEKVKNGLIFNSKYESKQMIFDSPHVIVFANEEPKEYKYSEDRLIIKKINEAGLEFEA